MADGTPIPTPTAEADADAPGAVRSRALAERQVEALGELVDIGLTLARAIGRHVDESAPEPPPLTDLNAAAMAYGRVARAVRQTILLQTRLQAEQAAAAARAGDVRVHVNRIVRRAIEAEHDDEERAERLAVEAAERLEQERYGDLLTRPVAEIIAVICRDLGLHPDWPDLEHDIAAAQAIARGRAGDADAASDDETDSYRLYWLDDDGRPKPAPGYDST